MDKKLKTTDKALADAIALLKEYQERFTPHGVMLGATERDLRARVDNIRVCDMNEED